MSLTLFDRFLVDIKWSTDGKLWYTNSADDRYRYRYLIALMKVDRTIDDENYEALQLIIGGFNVIAADLRSDSPVETIVKEKHKQETKN